MINKSALSADDAQCSWKLIALATHISIQINPNGFICEHHLPPVM